MPKPSPINAFQWRCSRCSKRYGLEDVEYTSGASGDLGVLDGEFDRSSLDASVPAAGSSLWRYRSLIPVGAAGVAAVRQDVGMTPLVESGRLARVAGVRSLAVKDDGQNPSGSLKDRASVVVVAHAIASGREAVCTASSGNAAVALAAAAAGTGLQAIAFVPASTPPAKLTQLSAYGARVILAEGGYEQAVRASRLAAARLGWYCRNTAFNPFTTQGKKTVALEIAEQASGEPADVVVVPAGDGNILTAVHLGFRDALALGWIPRMPRLVAVQSANADAIHHAWAHGLDEPTARPATSRADSINVAEPQDGHRALRAVRETGGAVVAVPDAELAEAARTMAREAGVFSEPAGATSWAGLIAARKLGFVTERDRVVLISTGHGLKDTEALRTSMPRLERLRETTDEAELGSMLLDL